MLTMHFKFVDLLIRSSKVQSLKITIINFTLIIFRFCNRFIILNHIITLIYVTVISNKNCILIILVAIKCTWDMIFFIESKLMFKIIPPLIILIKYHIWIDLFKVFYF